MRRRKDTALLLIKPHSFIAKFKKLQNKAKGGRIYDLFGTWANE